MIGAEFVIHEPQQKATMDVVSFKLPGMEGLGKSFRLHEEWYNVAQFTRTCTWFWCRTRNGMHGEAYQRPPYPATRAPMYGQGRVFYTSTGHHESGRIRSSNRFSWAESPGRSTMPKPTCRRTSPK